ncbi:YihY/virulence factor BrkB family protein [Protaetiibacter intestinalis]|uniref:YihY/virulence factor BrkB family protein n=1 Tax=Protaetiibacter intestinalis TaxID=2419774 RepID=A0A387B3T8_9MICO|nr:YhjD/YihY/BrkB family envelope integrity protein [Protaetiibacter intestinalis]AYF98294.1 YihY/virulence factor BrkB family protein [Protaetiibacter intestinalis]
MAPDAKRPPALVAWVQGVVAWVMRLKPVRVFLAYGAHRGPLLAAGLSNQAIFAVFAAIWVAFSVFGIVLAGNAELQDALLTLLANAVPGLIDTGEGGAIKPDDLINPAVLGWTGAVALVGLFFTALGWLASARDAIRVIGDLPGPRTNFLLLKLKDLGLAIGFGALLLVSSALSVLSSQALDGVLDWLGIRDSASTTIAARVLTIGLMFVLDTLVLAALYRVLAGVHIPLRFLVQGALLGALALGVLKILGTALLGGATNNPLLAGFAVIIGLLIWFTLICQVILIAACWVFVSMQDAGVPLDRRLAAEQAEAEAAERERLREELRAELAAERKPGFWRRLFGGRAR